MFDITKEESQNSVRMSWNVLPSNPIDLQRYIVPCGIHYTPLKQVDNLQILEYEPLTCKICKSVIAPQFQIDFRSKSWSCPFCESKNMFPTIYAQNISEQNLPAELLPEATTIEYKLNKKESKFPVFMFLIDIAIEESELSELKETIQSTLSLIPPECEIGIITYGTMCNLVELGFTDFPKMFVFKGEKKYSAQNIVTQLGLFNKNDPRIQSQNSKKFLVPLKDSEFAINSFLDDLFPDPFPVGFEERKSNCLGLAINVAISLLESVHNGEPCRIFIFAGGPCNIGSGKIVDLKLKETIRNYLDFEKGNENTYHFQEAIKYYEELADRAFKANQIIDIYSCCLNQIGLLEMKFLVEKTGGVMLLTDSFSTRSFKDTFNKIFESDEEGNLKMCFKGRSELFVTKPLKLKGALGHLVSMNIVNNENNNLKMVSNDYPIGQGNTRVWNLGGIDSTSTYTYILDIDSNNQNNNYRYGIIQFQTSYIASDRTTRLRVTTIKRKISPDLQNNKYEVAQSFDQEAAAVLLAKIAIDKNIKEERNLVLRWIDKTLIKLTSRFAEYNKDEPSSFRLTKEFAYFPQFIFYLRRSFVLKNFNASPDEVTQFKTILLRENVTNGTIMIQPALYSYSGENPESTPVLLEIENMKSDVVLLLDAFFFVCVWYGEDVCKWRDAGFQNEPGYENIKYMLDNPVDYAQSIVSERLPSPRFISADYGTGQERLIKSALDPNLSGSNEFKEGYFITDDVSLKVFMEHLIRKAVAS
jgi:protein transport protein SEC23